MILNPICDSCGEAIAIHLVRATKWQQDMLCRSCHETVDHEAIYECRRLVCDVKEALRWLITDNPDVTTQEAADWFVNNTAVPVFLAPFESAVKEALRDRDTFIPRRVPGSRAFRYVLAEEVTEPRI